ncbi:MAG: response regulator [bacterium]|nr:MAG: response regulator [bacterium]
MKRILVADDSVTIQKVIALTFADEPYEVKSVGTGAEALETMKSWKPDIVLADVIMPQMNGYELCRAVKGQQETSSIPVLLLAGTFEAFDSDEAGSVGADDFITKPFESAELIEKVRGLTGETVQPEAVQPPQQPAAPEPPPAAQQKAPAQPSPEAAEPDIWDILSDTGGEKATSEVSGESGSPAPGFGPLEDAGVIDVGSFDVGLDRPEHVPAPAPKPPQAVQGQQAKTTAAVQPTAPAPGDEMPSRQADMQPPHERSRVEDREKDFFGFDTQGAVEAMEPGGLEDAVEEVTFDIEESLLEGGAPSPEASFVVPEPAGDQPLVTGETMTPDMMAPVQTEPPEPEAPAAFDEPFFEMIPDVEPPAPPAPKPEAAAPAPAGPPPFQPPAEEPPASAPELSPPPAVEQPGPTGPVPTAGVPAAQPGAPGGAAGLDEAAVRRIIEEKVEKIAWEVVPEMAEALIREAIERIKGGT